MDFGEEYSSKGAGRVRRVEVRELWVQDRVVKGELSIAEAKGEHIVAGGFYQARREE